MENRQLISWADSTEISRNTPTTVTDELSASLLDRLGAAALVELPVT
ncbi:MAG: hypothetical protein ACRDNO_07270 [Trebonia sp.]